MPRPKNKTIGSCPCSMKTCDEVAEVRKLRGEGKLYLYCRECGTIRPSGQKFQNFILENAAMNGAEPLREPAPTPAPIEPEPKPAPVPEPVKTGWDLDDL